MLIFFSHSHIKHSLFFVVVFSSSIRLFLFLLSASLLSFIDDARTHKQKTNKSKSFLHSIEPLIWLSLLVVHTHNHKNISYNCVYIFVFIFSLHSLSFIFQGVSYCVCVRYCVSACVRFKLLLWLYMISVQMYLCVRVLCVCGLMLSSLCFAIFPLFSLSHFIETKRYSTFHIDSYSYAFTLVRVTQVCQCLCAFLSMPIFFIHFICVSLFTFYTYVYWFNRNVFVYTKP